MTAKKSEASPDKRRKYDEAFKAEALRLAGESHSTQVTARQLGINPWFNPMLNKHVGQGGTQPAFARRYVARKK